MGLEAMAKRNLRDWWARTSEDILLKYMSGTPSLYVTSVSGYQRPGGASIPG